MTNVPSFELKDIQDRFIENLSGGGIPAGEKMVADLAVEAEAMDVLNNVTYQIDHEDMADIRPFKNLFDIIGVIDLTDGIQDEYELTMSRLSFALMMLESVKNKSV